MALNQYRLGSKALTYAVQSYAVAGTETYYDDYMAELNEHKNREKALVPQNYRMDIRKILCYYISTDLSWLHRTHRRRKLYEHLFS
mgnify:CR=1 FL=1